MDKKIREHLIKVAEKNNWSTEEETLIEILLEGSKTVWEGNEDEHRWWEEYDRVVEIEGMFIKFRDAKTTGDDSPYEKGWELDSSTIREVKPVKKNIEVTEYMDV